MPVWRYAQMVELISVDEHECSDLPLIADDPPRAFAVCNHVLEIASRFIVRVNAPKVRHRLLACREMNGRDRRSIFGLCFSDNKVVRLAHRPIVSQPLPSPALVGSFAVQGGFSLQVWPQFCIIAPLPVQFTAIAPCQREDLSSFTIISRITNFWTLPVTVMG